jgi:hypothetical protein
MSLLSRLFGGGSAAKAPASASVEPEIYKDYRIFVEPIREAGGHRVAARIEKEIGGAVRTHRMIRADLSESVDLARETSLRKAKLLIDQMGEAIFD